jgi:hypothetical protein
MKKQKYWNTFFSLIVNIQRMTFAYQVPNWHLETRLLSCHCINSDNWATGNRQSLQMSDQIIVNDCRCRQYYSRHSAFFTTIFLYFYHLITFFSKENISHFIMELGDERFMQTNIVFQFYCWLVDLVLSLIFIFFI